MSSSSEQSSDRTGSSSYISGPGDRLIDTQINEAPESTTAPTVTENSSSAKGEDNALGKGDETCRHWILDTGAATHVCCKRDMFTTYTELDPPVTMNGCGTAVALGIGTVSLASEQGDYIHVIDLTDVYFIPTMPLNIIGVSVYTENDGVYYYLDKYQAQIRYEDRQTSEDILILSGTVRGRFAYLDYCSFVDTSKEAEGEGRLE